MSIDEITNKLYKLLADNYRITDFDMFKDTSKEISLLDPKIGMQPRDLLSFFLTVEKEFNIKFCQDDIVGVRLDYIGKMTEAICGKV